MHILILPSWYPTKENPVRGSFFAEQAEALARYGHTVTVVPLHDDAQKGAWIEERRNGSLTEYAVHYKKMPFHLTYFRIMTALNEIVGKRLRNSRPDIVHVHSFQAAKYARGLKAAFRLPYVVTEHVSWFERGLLSDKKLRSIRREYAGASAVIAVSAGLKDQIQPLCPEEIIVIPNLVNDMFFRGELHREGGETFGFISVGNLDKNKGMDLVLSAFSYALAVCPEIRLTVVGDGEEREALAAQAEDLGIGDKVRFTGRVSREECAALMRAHQAFVLGSRVETFGVVFVEAMACGLPIAMTKTGAWRDLVTIQTGFVTPVDDAHALAGSMARLARDKADYDSAGIREFCRSRFSEAAVCRRITEVYTSVLERDQ